MREKVLRIAVLSFWIGLCLLTSGCVVKVDKTHSAASGAGAPPEKAALVGNLPIAFPLTNTPKTLKILITGYNGRDQEDVYVWKEYEKMTGVNIQWDTVSKETRAEKVAGILTNHQRYDLILRCKLSATRLLNYGKSGLILDLVKDGMLEKYAPNCWAYLQSHPDTLASVMNPDGAIYALPQVNSGAELRVAMKLYVNKLWLERVHKALPTTTQELRDLLLAFKEQDANGNGDPNDEIPLSADWDSYKMSLYGAFGLANRGYHNETIDCDPATGEPRFIEGSEAYQHFLRYTRDLYADGLLDKAVFDIGTEQMMGYVAADRVGVIAFTNLALLPADKVGDWVAVEEALAGPGGDKMWSAIRANFHSTGAAVIPATCADPALALRWLDYFWTDAGTLFYHMGVEGETYAAKDDGSYDYLPAIYDEIVEKNLPFDDIVSEYSPYPGGSNPTVETAPYFMGGEMADVPARAARALIAYGPEEYWPSFTFTQEENDALNAVKPDMDRYTADMRVGFVTGSKSLDEWDAYLAQLDRLGAGEMARVYQAAVDRYHALSAALG